MRDLDVTCMRVCSGAEWWCQIAQIRGVHELCYPQGCASFKSHVHHPRTHGRSVHTARVVGMTSGCPAITAHRELKTAFRFVITLHLIVVGVDCTDISSIVVRVRSVQLLPLWLRCRLKPHVAVGAEMSAFDCC
jgi:hypothetical protein